MGRGRHVGNGVTGRADLRGWTHTAPSPGAGQAVSSSHCLPLIWEFVANTHSFGNTKKQEGCLDDVRAECALR